jgi:hypothetical protein
MLALFGNFHNTGSDQTLLPEGNLHKIIDIDLHETTGGTNSCQTCQDLQNNTHLKGIHMRMDDIALGEVRTDGLGLWVPPVRRGSTEGVTAALTRPL